MEDSIERNMVSIDWIVAQYELWGVQVSDHYEVPGILLIYMILFIRVNKSVWYWEKISAVHCSRFVQFQKWTIEIPGKMGFHLSFYTNNKNVVAIHKDYPQSIYSFLDILESFPVVSTSMLQCFWRPNSVRSWALKLSRGLERVRKIDRIPRDIFGMSRIMEQLLEALKHEDPEPEAPSYYDF